MGLGPDRTSGNTATPGVEIAVGVALVSTSIGIPKNHRKIVEIPEIVENSSKSQKS